MASTLQVTLRPARKSDIPALIEISGASFEHDTHTQLKGLAQNPPVSAPEYMSQGAEAFFLSRFDRSSASITVATVLSPTSRGEEIIAGYLVTGSRGLTNEQQQERTTPLRTVVQNRGLKPSSPDPGTATGTISDLAALTDRSMSEWQTWFLTPSPGATEEAPCYFIVSMSVHPALQSHGVGAALMQDLLRKCDARNLSCWVQSSHGAYAFYARHGLEEVGRLEVDLDRFNGMEDGRKVVRPEMQDGEKWGRYVWAYMERPPLRG